tara:strand:+ start:452 stop:775 length:324 start_codon:yes stop_codon:yes gene_type:complete
MPKKSKEKLLTIITQQAQEIEKLELDLANTENIARDFLEQKLTLESTLSEQKKAKKNPVGRPKKHNETQSKTMRLPIHLIEKINKDKHEGESFTDALIRLVSIGLLL